uniref:ATP synthase subunit a n=1 Tax=Parachtes romandiolae TaxID=1110492 RepID=A0A516IMN8_9ARAC|nr:ATP synthase F0 subunit 6 [Parachtes romandiolae]QDP17908.1 ATP synthase F0 subunit 6 [Parachtes romandiolae]
MVMNLFTVFDPCVGGLQLNWFSLLLVFMFIPFSYYLVGGTFSKGVGGIFKGVGDSLKEIVFPFYLVLVLLGLSVFLFMMLNNVMGLFSFVFTSTAHPVFTLGVGLVYWVGFMIMGWVQTFTKCAAHLVPEGSPLLLAPLLVVIELISHLIRPFTLSIRLAANMMAGHLIMGLLSSISLLSGVSFFVSIFLQMVLFVLEIAVALIQGLVFSILMLLYAVEFY